MKLLTGKGLLNEKNPLWKGEHASYAAKHMWVYRRLGKAIVCEKCGETERLVNWANKSGQYLRVENDWMQLCISCHRHYDGHHKFTRKKALEIRKEYNVGGISQQKLADKYGVSRCAVVNAIQGRIKAYV